VKKDKPEFLQGTLDLLVLKTVETMGPLHGWAIAKRIEQVLHDLLEMKYGTLYPALMRLEQSGWISSEWGTSENNRRARFYSITKQGGSSWRSKRRAGSRCPRSSPAYSAALGKGNQDGDFPFAGFESLRAVPTAGVGRSRR
jgi:transcriptional regulator